MNYLTVAITQDPGHMGQCFRLMRQCVGLIGRASALSIDAAISRPALQRVVKSLITASTRLQDVHERVHATELEGSRRTFYIRYCENSDLARVYLNSCTELCQNAADQISQASLWDTLRSMGSFSVCLRASRDMLKKAEASIELAILFANWLELSYAYVENAYHVTKLRNILADIKPHKSRLDEASTKSLTECDEAMWIAYHIWCNIGALMTPLECYAKSDYNADYIDDLPSREDVVQLIAKNNAACVQIETHILVAEKILARSLNPAI